MIYALKQLEFVYFLLQTDCVTSRVFAVFPYKEIASVKSIIFSEKNVIIIEKMSGTARDQWAWS